MSKRGEGTRPIFAREEIIQANERNRYVSGSSPLRSLPTDEPHRVVAAPQTQSSGGPRFESPGRYGSSYNSASRFSGERKRDSPSHDYGRPRDYERSHPSLSSFDFRDKNRDDRFERRDDLRHGLEVRRRDDSRYSGHHSRSMRSPGSMRYEKGRDYRDSDRHERELGRHPMDRHEMMERDRDRRTMMQSSPPPGERRRGPGEGFDPDRKMQDGRMPSGSHGPGSRRNDHPDRFHQANEFGPRERFQKPWENNPEYVPKGRSYFEHDNRDEMRIPSRGRGSMGPRGYMRGRGMMRGRPFRGAGPSRGFMGGRGTGRRGYSRGFYNIY